MEKFKGVPGPVVTVIMDGVGIGRGDEGDAVALATTPCLDRINHSAFSHQLHAHGTAVGMPTSKDMGNSEVGHNVIGGGRVFDQGAKLVDQEISSGRLYQSKTWKKAIQQVIQHKSALHFVGLLSDGNVHSHIKHLLDMINTAAKMGVKKVFIHPLLDGRDVSKISTHLYVKELEACLEKHHGTNGKVYQIASGGGRMTTTMDRYNADWEMVHRGWKVHVLGEGRGFASALQAIETFRNEKPGICDQDLPDFVITENGRPVGTIEDGSSVLAFNFRGDRMIELCQAFETKDFDRFNRQRHPEVFFAAMTQYDGDTQTPKHFLVSPPQITDCLGELLCGAGITQLACSETQKFGHVTYFWNGNRSGYLDEKKEKYIEIPSILTPYENHPAMSAPQITDAVIREIQSGQWRFGRLNYANGDMVGHTGHFEATRKAVEIVDREVQRLLEVVLPLDGAVIVTADHGNADDMVERNKAGDIIRENNRTIAKVSHSLNPVPFSLNLSDDYANRFVKNHLEAPSLGNIASTILTVLGYKTPESYLPSLVSLRDAR